MNKTVTGEDKDRNKIEMNISDLSWRISVYGIVTKDEKVLMISQNFGYSLPGGGIDLGETIENAISREVLDETGYNVQIKKIIDVQTSFFRHPSFNKDVHAIRIFFSCENGLNFQN
ncbi:MAG: NUDIX domain-containing protein [Patescibacteria group bacterium]|nr:NUDIX domain-containing protein [Patescibacteria group bacterium]